ncbi:Solute carrier family 25 member 40 [Choanephora cucurbitarum]|uniref:Solute carrier family 25 member 40 n=1 Tax=Choanephora cucurbitarum TaxID=101091 RepID=A0A1C7NBL2_9FUNG|nr:Solute carrier family 25 member 40 [Choanephora cucurbitarum]
MSTNYTTTPSEKLLSACGGALLTSVMVTPMDVVKMRMQTQHPYQLASKASLCCSTFNQCVHSIKHNIQHNRITRSSALLCPTPPTVSFKGTLDGLYKIFKYEGASALWKGLSPALLMSVPANVIYLVGYDHLKDTIQPWLGSYREYAPLVAGAAARTIAVSIISPIELFRTRLQAATHGFSDVMEGVKKMVAQDGSKALWRGLPPTLWRDVPFSAIYWMGYEECKQSLESLKDQSMSDLHVAFLAGALSGMFAAAITTPFDVAKTRRQVDAGKEIPTLIDSRVPAILRQIYTEDGIRGLFRGMTPRIAKIGPSCAIMISSYEMGKVFFSKQHATL